MAANPEERIVRDVLLGEADGVVVVADASNIEGSLHLTSQLIEHYISVIR